MQVGSRQDLIQTIPALERLRQLLPNAAITLMVSFDSSQMGLQMPWVDDLLVYEGIDAKFVNAECELALISKLHQCAFDAAVIFTKLTESPYPLAYICYLAGIPIRIGQSQEFGGGLLSEWVKPQPNEQSAEDQHLFLLESAFPTYRRSAGTSLPHSRTDVPPERLFPTPLINIWVANLSGCHWQNSRVSGLAATVFAGK